MNQNSLFKEYEDLFGEEEPSGKGKKEKIFGYSPFALQDAIGERNIKKIWIEYQKLILAGVEADELIHKIVSKVRDMAGIKSGAGKEDLDIKSDYPYNKSKRDLKNWKEEELKSLYAKLVEIYHHSRMGGDDMGTAVEKIILSI